MAERPFVTIAVTSSDDETRIDACLGMAIAQDYPADRFEILVADAMSMDATREIVLRVAERHPQVRLIDNADRTRAGGLNAALAHARGEILVPMDPGTEYAKTHVTKCVDALSDSPAEHLAIVPRFAGRTLVERALSAVQATRLAFAVGAELTQGSDPVPAFIGAIKRRVFDQVGLYDAEARCEEDVELGRRITRAGGAVTVRRDIVVHRSEASSFADLFHRHFVLGRSRAERVLKERKVESMRTLAPLALVVAGSAMAATSSVQPVTPLALAAYALVTGAAAVRVGRREGLVTIPFAWAAYPVMHFAQGAGMGAGIAAAIARVTSRREPRPVSA